LNPLAFIFLVPQTAKPQQGVILPWLKVHLEARLDLFFQQGFQFPEESRPSSPVMASDPDYNVVDLFNPEQFDALSAHGYGMVDAHYPATVRHCQPPIARLGQVQKGIRVYVDTVHFTISPANFRRTRETVICEQPTLAAILC
jgi:hypothetical protein